MTTRIEKGRDKDIQSRVEKTSDTITSDITAQSRVDTEEDVTQNKALSNGGSAVNVHSRVETNVSKKVDGVLDDEKDKKNNVNAAFHRILSI